MFDWTVSTIEGLNSTRVKVLNVSCSSGKPKTGRKENFHFCSFGVEILFVDQSKEYMTMYNNNDDENSDPKSLHNCKMIQGFAVVNTE